MLLVVVVVLVKMVVVVVTAVVAMAPATTQLVLLAWLLSLMLLVPTQLLFLQRYPVLEMEVLALESLLVMVVVVLLEWMVVLVEVSGLSGVVQLRPRLARTLLTQGLVGVVVVVRRALASVSQRVGGRARVLSLALLGGQVCWPLLVRDK